MVRLKICKISVQAGREVEALLDDGDKHINRDGNPDLGFDGVLGGTEEDFDTKMLFDPFEKQLDLPPAAIKFGDGQCRQDEIIGEKYQPLAGYWIFESDTTQRCVEVLARVKAGEHDSLIANQPRTSIDRMRITTLGFEVGFGAGDKEAFRLVQPIKPLKSMYPRSMT